MAHDTRPTRDEALKILQTLTTEQREAIAVLAETQETAGTYVYCGEGNGSVYEDDVQGTLSDLAELFRKRK